MKLSTEFVKLPFTFDEQKLQEDISQFSEKDWQPHPQGFKGNSALLLLSPEGDPTNDGLKGEMLPTPHLKKCPYLIQVLVSLDVPIGRTRLMRLEPNSQVTEHIDSDYYWQQRVRIHIPIKTTPDVKFCCGDRQVHMAAGECWIFNTFEMHNVLNDDNHTRIHLVVDTVGNGKFWRMVKDVQNNKSTWVLGAAPQASLAKMKRERVNSSVVMSPWEFKYLLDYCVSAYDGPSKSLLQDIADEAYYDWLAMWSQHSMDSERISHGQRLLRKLAESMAPFSGEKMSNGSSFVQALKKIVFDAALNPGLVKQKPKHGVHVRRTSKTSRFDRPIIIVSAPRSGSTFLFETLGRSPELLSMQKESHGVIESIPSLNPEIMHFISNRLDESNYSEEIRETLAKGFFSNLKNHRGRKVQPQSSFRFLEKTPKNALRIPFLNKVFPDAKFIYLYRKPEPNIASIIEAWLSKKFCTYQLPDWKGSAEWSLLLIPGWRDLIGKSIAEIAVTQWETANQTIMRDLQEIPDSRIRSVTYGDLMVFRQETIDKLCEFAEIPSVTVDGVDLPLSKHTLTPPAYGKWRVHEAEISPFSARLEKIDSMYKAHFPA